MGPDDQVILVTHQPRWLMDWFWEEAATHNLRQLVRGHLRGRARIHLAGQPAAPQATALALDHCGASKKLSGSSSSC